MGKELRRLSVEEEGGTYAHAPDAQVLAAGERKRTGTAVRRNNIYLYQQLVGWAIRVFVNFGYFG